VDFSVGFTDGLFYALKDLRAALVQVLDAVGDLEDGLLTSQIVGYDWQVKELLAHIFISVILKVEIQNRI